MGDDEQEEANMQEEEKLSERMLSDLKIMLKESRILSKEYKDLFKRGRKLAKVIKVKERKNEDELRRMQTIEKDQDHVKDIRHEAAALKGEEKQERRLSAEEAGLLKDMLHELNDVSGHGKAIIKTNDEFHALIRDAYKKDLADYELEGKDI